MMAVKIKYGKQAAVPVVRLAAKGEKLPVKLEKGEHYLLNTGKKAELYLYLGKSEEVKKEDIRKAGLLAHKLAEETKNKKVALVLSKKVKMSDGEQAGLFAEGVILADFKADYKSKKEKKKGLECLLLPTLPKKEKETVDKHIILAESQNYARELANTPANKGTPEFCAKKAKELAKEIKAKIEVWDKKTMAKKGMNLALAVNSGSARNAYFVHITYKGPKAKKKVAVVGKGITFDSGGIGIKPGRYMLDMNLDKSGACVMLGIVRAAAKLKLPIELHGIAIFTENMPGAAAYKPSDVIKGYGGKTVEILHTDAEGRLILADALAFASKNVKPELIIDLATLTGAMGVALGKYAIGLFPNEKGEKFIDAFKKAGEETYERVWPFPMFSEYGEMVKSDIADVKNLGSWDGDAGSITAAKFLEAFVDKKVAWIHLDIASMMETNISYIGKRGAAPGVRLVVKGLEKLL